MMSVTLLRQDYSSQLSVRNELTGRPSQNRSPSAQSLKAYLTATGFSQSRSLHTFCCALSILGWMEHAVFACHFK